MSLFYQGFLPAVHIVAQQSGKSNPCLLWQERRLPARGAAGGAQPSQVLALNPYLTALTWVRILSRRYENDLVLMTRANSFL